MKSNERLKQIRKELKLSQIELCNILGIKQGAYSQVESGKVGISGSIKLILSKEFNVNLDWLDTGEGDMFTTENTTITKAKPISDKQNKLNFIYDTVKEHNITSYEIYKNTTLTEAGASKIINRESSNPHLRSINEIYNYLNNKYGENAIVVNTTIQERFEQVLEHYNINAKQFAERMGERPEKYYKILRGDTQSMNSETQDNINNYYPDINIDWLLSGIGQPFVVSSTKKVPYYDIDATASQIEVYSETFEEPAYYMSIPAFSDCNFACNVYGDSMYPMFQSGEVIVCKEQGNNIIQYGEVYLIITNELADNLRTIKKIRKCKADDSLVTLAPSNPNFDSFEIPKESIVKLYLIKGKIKRNTM